MRVRLFCSLMVSICALPGRLAAQDASEPAPYDGGYAYAASKACPNTVLVRPASPEAQTGEQFKRGMAMFDHYVAVQSVEGACKAALNLYNDATGKAGKLLHVK